MLTVLKASYIIVRHTGTSLHALPLIDFNGTTKLIIHLHVQACRPASYKCCVGCHGQKFQSFGSCLQFSRIIELWSDRHVLQGRALTANALCNFGYCEHKAWQALQCFGKQRGIPLP